MSVKRSALVTHPALFMFLHRRLFMAAFFSTFVAAISVHAWDYAGHRAVNQLALASLPADFPSFVREAAAVERIAFLAGEPDRWRNVSDPTMRHSGGSWSEHFLDFEQLALAGLDANNLPSFRYDFVVAFAAGRNAHADRFPRIDPAKNSDHTREWPGFAPWAIVEYYTRVKSAFSYLKAFEENGTPEEIANAKANAIYVMGVMGHFVGDVAQPLHTTDHHNGWIGSNPNGYTTRSNFHSWIDGGFIDKVGLHLSDLKGRVTPAQVIPVTPRNDERDPVFVAVMNYFVGQHALVEPLYQMEKDGKFTVESPLAPEGTAFIEAQLLKGGEMLGSLWLTAYRSAGPDVFLRTQLLKRQAASRSPAPR
ncbi:MAG: hypothetical protein ABIZ04_13545 [Opitutus sp.]